MSLRRLGPLLTVGVLGVLVVVAIAVSVISSPERTATSDLRAAIARTLAAPSFTIRGSEILMSPFDPTGQHLPVIAMMGVYQAPDRYLLDYCDPRNSSCRTRSGERVIAIGSNLYVCAQGLAQSLGHYCQFQTGSTARRELNAFKRSFLPDIQRDVGANSVVAESPGYVVQQSNTIRLPTLSGSVRLPVTTTLAYGVAQGYVVSFNLTESWQMVGS